MKKVKTEIATCCPLCEGKLEIREVTPCMECGADPREKQHSDSGLHTYEEVIAFGKFPLILCDFCQVDFGSYPHFFFGMPIDQHTGFDSLTPIRSLKKIEIKMSEDGYCPECGYRLSFLNFVKEVREFHKNS